MESGASSTTPVASTSAPRPLVTPAPVSYNPYLNIAKPGAGRGVVPPINSYAYSPRPGAPMAYTVPVSAAYSVPNPNAYRAVPNQGRGAAPAKPLARPTPVTAAKPAPKSGKLMSSKPTTKTRPEVDSDAGSSDAESDEGWGSDEDSAQAREARVARTQTALDWFANATEAELIEVTGSNNFTILRWFSSDI